MKQHALQILQVLLLSALQYPSSTEGFAFVSPRKSQAKVSFPPQQTLSSISSRQFSLILQSSPNAAAAAAADDDDDAAAPAEEQIDLGIDDRLYRIRLSRATGIEWGTDLSFSFVYVRAMDPAGEAAMTRHIEVGDQLCELRAVMEDTTDDDSPAVVNLVGAPFDFVMTTFANLDKTVRELDLVFFKGTKEELKAACEGGEGQVKDPETVTITVIQNKGSKEEEIKILTAPTGSNLREVLVENDINVYQSFTRWTNCKGKQLCGTCIVNVTDGAINTNRKSMDEESTLRENPDRYRLSCVAFAYGDVTVETFPPIEAAQWTR